MFWQEDEDKSLPFQTPDEIVDALFSIRCKQLPVDHIWSLQKALLNALVGTTLEQSLEKNQSSNYSDVGQIPLGIHPIHVAESSNGWTRPDTTESFLFPSNRTKLIIRTHKDQLDALSSLCNQQLQIDSYSLNIGKMKTRLLTNTSVIFSRNLVCLDENETEDDFLRRYAQDIFKLTGVKTKKMMCGRSHQIATPDGLVHTRHLMIADLDSEPSIKLQQFGLGSHRQLGCGIFLPHKGIKSLNATE